MNTRVDTATLQWLLAQARAECALWSAMAQRERWRDAAFVAAMLELRLRHRLGEAATDPAGAPAPALATP